MSASYRECRNVNLPWGYWLVANGDVLIDEQGAAWSSLREYLWCGRLGMVANGPETIDTQLELLLAMLVAIDRKVIATEERVSELFGGAWHLHGHYLLWLQSVGLTTRPLGDALTDEGRAVLVMLASTRSATSAPLPIGLATLDPRMGLDHGATREERERVLAAHEAFAQDLPARFVRAAIAGQPGITLVAEQRGRNIPLTRVLWSQVFPDDHARDRLYAWLAGRIDRWEVWADLAEHKGSQALSDRLLLLAFADRPAGPEG